MKAPIQSTKHYVQLGLTTVATVTRSNEVLAEGTQVQDIASPDDALAGSVIKAVYIELWTLGSSADGFQVITLGKYDPTVSPTFAQMSLLNDFPSKKNILFTHEGLSANDGVGNPVLVMRNWYKIPKGKQRFGLGDRLILSISNPSANTLTYCGFATYKEYR